MRKLLHTFIFLFSISVFHVKAQQTNTIITGQITETVCREKSIALPFTSTGIFEASNVFTVQIRPTNSTQWTDLQTIGNSSPMNFIIPSTFDVSNWGSYFIRITASKPSIIGSQIGISSIFSKPKVSLIGSSLLNVNPFESTELRFTGTGLSPVKVVFDDSSSVNIFNLNSNNVPTNVSFYPSSTRDYKVVYSENVCGRGEATGNVSITVNPLPLKVLLKTNENVCVDGTMKIQYAAGGKFDSNNTFKIGLRQTFGNFREYEIDATEKDGIIEAKIPNFIQTGISYNVRLVSSSPRVISPWNTDFSFLIGEKHSAELVSANPIITWGKEVEIRVNYTGIGPWSVVLNDGTILYNNIIGLATNPASANYFITTIKPDKTQNYSIKSFSSACGSGGSGENSVNVTVKSGVVIDSLKQSLEVCLGDSFSARYTTKADFGSPNTLVAYVGISDNKSEAPLRIPATFNNGIVKVTIPTNLFASKPQLYSSYNLGIAFGNEEISYSSNFIRINSLPQASFANTNEINIATKSLVNLPLLVSGASPITITLSDSTVVQAQTWSGFVNNFTTQLPVPVIKMTPYKILSVSNACGVVTVNDNKTVTVNVRNLANNDISIKNAPSATCAGAKAKIHFNTLGNFNTNNQYSVELLQFETVVSVIGTGKTSPIEITIPENTILNTFNYFIRIRSSNPTAVSDRVAILINKKPEVSLLPLADLTRSILPNDKINFSINSNNSLINLSTYLFSDGSLLNGNSAVTKSFANSTTFSIKSASNECGEGIVRGNPYKITVVPFKIIPKFYNFSVTDNTIYDKKPCVGELINYAYSLSGNVEMGTTFNLQIASTKDSIFKDLVSKTTENPISVKLPLDLKDGNYFMRLVSNTSPQQISPFTTFGVQTPSTVTLSGLNAVNNTVTVNAPNPVTLKYDTKGGTPTTVLTGDGFSNFFRLILSNSSTYNYQITPLKSTTYTIKSVESSCGYGAIEGNPVKLTVIPTLYVQNAPPSAFCTGNESEISYAAYGEYEPGNIFTFSIISQSLLDNQGNSIKYEIGKITSNKNGIIKIKIPSDVPIGQYQLEVSSTKPAATSKYTIQTVATQPDITISGNTIINPGEEAYFNVFNNNIRKYPNYSDNLFYTLSNNLSYSPPPNLYRSVAFVKPSQTTTYTVSSVRNLCGLGKATGSFTVTVNPVFDKTITIDFNKTILNRSLCTGTSYDVYFLTKGIFSATNKFSVQISDKNGDNYKDIVSQGTQSPLKITIPDDLPEGNDYRIRVIATDKEVGSSSYLTPLIGSASPTLTLDSTTYFFKEGKPVNIKMNLTGTPPWAVKFGIEESTARSYFGIEKSPFTVQVNPSLPTTYKIFSINNEYCPGKIVGTNTVKIELITANEEIPDFEVKIFPNPTADKITIQSDNFKNTSLQITDNLGRQILQQNINKSETVLDISDFKTGQYYLQIERENKRNVYKIMKL